MSLGASPTAEFLQIFTPYGFPSIEDVVAQTAGCVLGLLCWGLIGRALTDWVRGATRSNKRDRLVVVLVGWAAATTIGLWARSVVGTTVRLKPDATPDARSG